MSSDHVNAKLESDRIAVRPARMTQPDHQGLSADSIELLATKLRPPVPSGSVVGQRRVHALQEDATAHRVTLVTGPTGYGKTTRLAAWCTAPAGPREELRAWLSVGPGGNDPWTFLRCLLAALGTVHPEAVKRSQALLTVSGRTSTRRSPGSRTISRLRRRSPRSW